MLAETILYAIKTPTRAAIAAIRQLPERISFRYACI
jgi:hypothetical protein